VIGDIGMHGADDSDLVDAFGHMREEVAHLDAALASGLEFEGGWERGTGFSLRLRVFHRQQLASVGLQLGFGIEGVDVGGTSVHEQVNHPFGLAVEVGWLGAERRQRGGLFVGPGQERGQAEGPHAHAASRKKIAPGQKRILYPWCVVFHRKTVR
jgi:hypothetical protein